MQTNLLTSIAEAPALLSRLGANASIDALEQVTAWQEALPTVNDPAQIKALARALPSQVADLSPEVVMALLQMAQALVPYAPQIPQDIDELPPKLRVLWHRVQLATGKSDHLAMLDETFLLHVVTGWSPQELLAPHALLRHLSEAQDPRLRQVLLSWLRPCVEELAITPKEAFVCLLPLLSDPHPTLRLAALQELSACWLQDLPDLTLRQRDALLFEAMADFAGAELAMLTEIAAQMGLRKGLQALLHDGPAATQAAALQVIGALAQPEDLTLALQLATADPLRFGPAARQCIIDAHRHGVFVRSKHIDALLQQYDQHTAWSAEELRRVTYIVRQETLDALQALPTEDPRWQRRAALLSLYPLPAAMPLLARKLAEVQDPKIAEALLNAAFDAPAFQDEAPLLRWLNRLPHTVLPGLYHKGGPLAVQHCKQLAEDPFCTHEDRQAAIKVVWAHANDREPWLRTLATQIGPHESGILSNQYLASQDPTIAELLTQPPWEESPAHQIKAPQALEILCEAGDIRHLAQVTTLFRQVFRGYVRLALGGDFTVKRLQIPALEQMVFRYGRHLCKAGRVLRRWREEAPETGRDLLLSIACDWLDESPSEAVCVALLELIGRHAPGPAILQRIMPFWRSTHRGIQRAAIEAILEAGEDARGLELSLCQLVESQEPRIVCQALHAAKVLQATWAEPIVIQALSRPEMAVKKEAADALSTLGSHRAVPALLNWLAYHDNGGFRAYLHAALQRAAGPTYVAALVHALAQTPEQNPRHQELLWCALDGHITITALLRLARSTEPAHMALVKACLDGQVRLKDASTQELTARLHMAQLLPQEIPEDPSAAIRAKGFSPALASDLVDTWQEQQTQHPEDPTTKALTGKILNVIRLEMAAWLTWLLETNAQIRPTAASLLLQAANSTHAEYCDRYLDLIEQVCPQLPPDTIIEFFERCLTTTQIKAHQKLRAVEILRRLPPSATIGGLRRYRLPARLGAISNKDDLDVALASCRIGPHLASESALLLCEVFSIPTKRKGEPEAITTIREEAQSWYHFDEATRETWLTTMLAQRPLGLPPLPPEVTPPRKATFAPTTQEHLDALVATLLDETNTQQERTKAATLLMKWPDAQPAAWHHVLHVFLRGHIELDAHHTTLLALQIDPLTQDKDAWPQLASILPYLSPQQRKECAQCWFEAWEQGDPDVIPWINAIPQQELYALLSARIKAGKYHFASLLQPGHSLLLRSIEQLLEAEAPEEARHLHKKDTDTPADAPNDEDEPVDPIAGLSADKLFALINKKDTDNGLAVRAVHALAELRAAQRLEQVVTDRRPQVRSAALRALRKVTSKEQTMAATMRALQMETRRDIILSLMASLGHARYTPALPEIMERLLHRNQHISQGAEAILQAWGSDAIPALQRASRKARPDRRSRYQTVIDQLSQTPTTPSTRENHS